MVETFAERQRERAVEQNLPNIRLEQPELHSPLDSFGRAARYLRAPTESTRIGLPDQVVARASRDMAVIDRVQHLIPEGSPSLASRLQRTLESI